MLNEYENNAAVWEVVLLRQQTEKYQLNEQLPSFWRIHCFATWPIILLSTPSSASYISIQPTFVWRPNCQMSPQSMSITSHALMIQYMIQDLSIKCTRATFCMSATKSRRQRLDFSRAEIEKSKFVASALMLLLRSGTQRSKNVASQHERHVCHSTRTY